MKPFSILHISDLHRSPRDPISNDELISALIQDRDRYVQEEPSITPPQAIVVSGDVIQGVPLGTEDFATKIEEQYAVAEEFLDELARRFVDGDRSRLVMVPGNHDVDWNTAFSALELVLGTKRFLVISVRNCRLKTPCCGGTGRLATCTVSRISRSTSGV